MFGKLNRLFSATGETSQARELNDMGVAAVNRQDLLASIEPFTKAIELAPGDHAIWFNRANTFFQLGRFDDALSDFDESIRLNPAFAESYAGRRAARDQLGRHDAALADFNQALQLDPATRAMELTQWENGEWIAILTAALAEAGRFDEAVARQQQAVELAPGAAAEEMKSRLRLYESRQPYRE